jgi:caspase domain-containing protein
MQFLRLLFLVATSLCWSGCMSYSLVAHKAPVGVPTSVETTSHLRPEITQLGPGQAAFTLSKHERTTSIQLEETTYKGEYDIELVIWEDDNIVVFYGSIAINLGLGPPVFLISAPLALIESASTDVPAPTRAEVPKVTEETTPLPEGTRFTIREEGLVSNPLQTSGEVGAEGQVVLDLRAWLREARDRVTATLAIEAGPLKGSVHFTAEQMEQLRAGLPAAGITFKSPSAEERARLMAERDLAELDLVLARQKAREPVEERPAAADEPEPEPEPKTRVVIKERNLAPIVALRPAANETSAAVLSISGYAKDDVGVVALEVRVNGELLDPGTLRGPGGVAPRVLSSPTPKRAFAFSIPIREGQNVIEVVARDAKGALGRDRLEVVRKVDRGTIHAAVIGVGAYTAARKLPYARGDAEAFHRYLTVDLGVPESQVHLLVDAAATRRSLSKLLVKTLPSVAAKGDTVIIFFAGHGGLEEAKETKSGLRSYLYPVDVDETDLYSSAIPMDELRRVFGRLESERVVFFGDCCYSGAASEESFAMRAGQTPFLSALGQGKGRVVFTACRPNELARGSKAHGRGLFTHFLLEGLRSKSCDTSGDGFVDTDELFSYVSPRVAKASRQTQHPEKSGSGRFVVGGSGK